MGTEDMRRQAPNVERMKLLGAEVGRRAPGARTLKDAVNEAIRDWVTNVETTHYLLGSALGPHPYPAWSRLPARHRATRRAGRFWPPTGRLPDAVIACVGGGSNAIGTFYAFIQDREVELIGIEAGGEGLQARHGASLVAGRTGVLHGALSSVLADPDGQILEAHSVSAGLDYPGVGPEHAQLRDSGRARYEAVTDAEALRAFRELARLEGILPALEPAHAIAWLLKDAQPASDPAGADAGAQEKSPSRRRGQEVSAGADQPAGFDLVCLSGRGDKDLAEAVAGLRELDG